MKQRLKFKIFEESKNEFPFDFVNLVYRQLLIGLSHIHSFDLVLGFIDNFNILITSKGIIDSKVGAKLINFNFNKRLDTINETFKITKELRFDFMPPELLPLDGD